MLLRKYGSNDIKNIIIFKNESQMAIPNKTVLDLIEKVIRTVDDLSLFDKETIVQIAYNLRRIPSGALFIIGAKSRKRLIVACELVLRNSQAQNHCCKYSMDRSKEEF